MSRPKITYVSASGVASTVEAEIGSNLMATALANGIDGITGECGGGMMCATCHCYVDEGFAEKLPDRSETEDEMLDWTASERRGNSRLCCQIVVGPETDGIIVHLPEVQ